MSVLPRIREMATMPQWLAVQIAVQIAVSELSRIKTFRNDLTARCSFTGSLSKAYPWAESAIGFRC